jgi:streptogramin lyase
VQHSPHLDFQSVHLVAEVSVRLTSSLLALAIVLALTVVTAGADRPAPVRAPAPLVVHRGGVTGTVVAGEGAVWIAAASEGRLYRVDPASGRTTASLVVGDQPALVRSHCAAPDSDSFYQGEFSARRCDLPSGLAVGAGSVWAARNDDRTLLRIDPRTARVVRAIPIGVFAFAVAASDDAVWVADYENEAVVRIDPRSERVVAELHDVPRGPAGFAITPRAVWASFGGSDLVARIDPGSDRIAATIPAGRRPLPVVSAFGAVWVHSEVSGTISRIDPAADAVVATIDASPPAGREGLDDIAVATDGLWFCSVDLVRVDPVANRIVQRLPMNPNAVTAGFGYLWVTESDGSVVRVSP